MYLAVVAICVLLNIAAVALIFINVKHVSAVYYNYLLKFNVFFL